MDFTTSYFFVIPYGNKVDLMIHHKERHFCQRRSEMDKWKDRTPAKYRFISNSNKIRRSINGSDLWKFAWSDSNTKMYSEEKYKEKSAQIARDEALKNENTMLESKARKEVRQRKKFELHQQNLSSKKN